MAPTPKTALITGVTGQDGAYLAAVRKGSSRLTELAERCTA